MTDVAELGLRERKRLATHRAIQMAALVEAALAVAEHSYSPYSGFRVGAALRLTTGELMTGTNVENVSYGLTICAERSALVSAVAEFGPGVRIAAVAIVNLNDAPSPPCGACRQVLAEFMQLVPESNKLHEPLLKIFKKKIKRQKKK